VEILSLVNHLMFYVVFSVVQVKGFSVRDKHDRVHFI